MQVIKIDPIDTTKICRTITYDHPGGKIMYIEPVLDPMSPAAFVGEIIANVPGIGSMTIGFRMEGVTSLEEACAQWIPLATDAITRAVDQAKTDRLRKDILAPGFKGRQS